MENRSKPVGSFLGFNYQSLRRARFTIRWTTSEIVDWGSSADTECYRRVSVSGRIIDQYVQYCNEIEVKPLSNSTLQRILSTCQASTRKSLQDLAYFVCEGSKAFGDLEQLIRNLADSGFDARTAQNLQMRLKGWKNYVKTDFKVRTYGNIIIKCVIPENFHTPPPPRRATEIQKRGGISKIAIFEGWGWQAISYFTLNRCSKAKIIFFIDDFLFAVGWVLFRSLHDDITIVAI